MVNEAFKKHVTSVAFHLILTRTQIETLVYIRREQRLHAAGFAVGLGGAHKMEAPRLFVPAVRALKERGLVVFQDPTSYSEDYKRPMYDPTKLSHSLTEAGEKVWDLLVMAGLVVDEELPVHERA